MLFTAHGLGETREEVAGARGVGGVGLLPAGEEKKNITLYNPCPDLYCPPRKKEKGSKQEEPE